MSEQTHWPIYKGPIKVPFRKRDRLYPERIGRHGKVYEPKHKGSEKPYELYLGHYEPKHKRRNYRYAKDGTIRKVLPKANSIQMNKTSIPPEKRSIPKGPDETPPPRTMLVHLWNDRYDHHFSLEEYRATREPLKWTKRFRTFNYFREVCMVEGLLMMFGLILMIQEATIWQITGTIMMIALLVLFPMTAISAIIHHLKNDRK